MPNFLHISFKYLVIYSLENIAFLRLNILKNQDLVDM